MITIKKITVGIFLLLVIGCSIPPSYTTQEIEKVIKSITKTEFNLDVEVTAKGDTIWIYAPLELINEKGEWFIDTEGKINEKISEQQRQIHQAIIRAFLNIDTPPKFYCFIMSETKKIGIDIYNIQFIPDAIKVQMGMISMGENSQRSIIFFNYSPKALNDLTGKHIKKYDIPMSEYISLVIEQNIIQTFSQPETAQNYKINNIDIKTIEGTIEVTFDVETIKYTKGLSIPRKKIIKISQNILDIYSEFTDISLIRLIDEQTKKTTNIYPDKKKRKTTLINPPPDKNSGNLQTLINVSFYMNLAQRYFDENKLDLAEKFYSKTLQIMPENISALNYMGNILQDQEPDGNKARSFFFKAKEIDPLYHETYYNIARSYFLSHDYSNALSEFLQLEKIKSNYPSLKKFIGLTYLYLDDYANALTNLRQALETSPNDSFIYQSLGQAHSALGEKTLANTYYKKALDLIQDNPDSEIASAEIHLAMGNNQEAVKNYRKALSSNPESSELHYGLASSLFSSGKYKEAIESYNKVIELTPNFISAYISLGICYNNINEPNKSIVQYKKALSLEQNNPKALYHLALTYLQQAKYDLAEKLFLELLAIIPDSPDVQNGLAKVYYFTSQHEKARIYFEKAKRLFTDINDYTNAKKIDEILRYIP
ncbi:MAG: tetratricopeptide repeat protein [Candidatus Omnitrophica bacterium]|nr:tetratricopeptide repeat protein [Candidatus Omnitrophota bacterium]